MSILIDLIAVLVFLLFIWRGKKRGFIKTVAGLLALILAFLGAGALASMTAEPIADAYIAGPVEDFLNGQVKENENIPREVLIDSLVESGVPEDFSDDVAENAPVAEILTKATSALSGKIAYAILCLIYFIVLLIVLKIVLKLLDKVFDLPGLKFANNTLGAVAGAIRGLIFIYLLAILIAKSGILIDEATLNGTYIVKALASFNIFAI